MYPQAFSLLSEEDPSLVFAFGLEIIGNDGEINTAVTFRLGDGGQHSFSVHESADRARATFSRVTPLTLEHVPQPAAPFGVDPWSRDEFDDA